MPVSVTIDDNGIVWKRFVLVETVCYFIQIYDFCHTYLNSKMNDIAIYLFIYFYELTKEQKCVCHSDARCLPLYMFLFKFFGRLHNLDLLSCLTPLGHISSHIKDREKTIFFLYTLYILASFYSNTSCQ